MVLIRRILIFVFLFMITHAYTTSGVRADGTITVPVNAAPTQWKINSVHLQTGIGASTPGVQIEVYLLNGAGVVQSVLVASQSQVEFNAYMTQMETPVAGEPAAATPAARAQRYRMRNTKWIVDNAKLSNITPE